MSAWSAHGVSLVGSARVRLCREDIWMSITATTDSGDVNCLATLSDSLFVAGSMDGSLRFFDSDEGRTCFCSIFQRSQRSFPFISPLLKEAISAYVFGNSRHDPLIQSRFLLVAAVVVVLLLCSYVVRIVCSVLLPLRPGTRGSSSQPSQWAGPLTALHQKGQRRLLLYVWGLLPLCP